ncbi:hypothetical protein MMC16_006126 [Acarospora aff. strigata]|nr:hypothetical protein [Acarospora aff. strigata]
MARSPAPKRRRLSPKIDAADDGSSQSSTADEVGQTGVDDFYSRAARWNLEQGYEQRPRNSSNRDKRSTRLPIKTADGRIEQLKVPEVVDEDGDSWLQSPDEDDPDEGIAMQEVEEAPKVPQRQQILEAKEELARIATLINEDPEEHTGSFRALANIASSKNATVKKLALATQLAVYKDVIPGYRIRPLAEDDMTEKVSKEVRRLRAFEQALVGSYLAYLKHLATLAKPSKGKVSEASASLATVALSCACALLLSVPHFNFRGELLKILVQKLSTLKIDQDYVKCRQTLETLFGNDDDGTPSLDAVALMTRMMKARNWRVDESVLNTFLHLRLLSEFSGRASQNHIDKPGHQYEIRGRKLKEKRVFRTKKQRKLEKERKGIEKEFKEADAVVSHEERDRMQAETLKLIFTTYFRILKARIAPLMGAVLEGLAKYAHLINQDFFGDLLEALKDLIAHTESLDDEEEDEQRSSRNPSRESLLCIITAFALLEGQDAHKAAASLSLDLSFFITHLYRTLYPLVLNPDLELSSKSLHLPDPNSPKTSTANNKVNVQTTTVLLVRCLSSVLLPQLAARAVPPVRVAAFSKQLLTSSLQLPEKSCLAMLGLMYKVSKIHRQKIAGLWNTEERKGDGVFDPLRAEIESSNPFASTVWEGEILRTHYCPNVRDAIMGLEKNILDVH